VGIDFLMGEVPPLGLGRIFWRIVSIMFCLAGLTIHTLELEPFCACRAPLILNQKSSTTQWTLRVSFVRMSEFYVPKFRVVWMATAIQLSRAGDESDACEALPYTTSAL
jgi:hypothetical protein